MTGLSRRRALKTLGAGALAAGGGAVLGACSRSGAPQSGGGEDGPPVLTWWDNSLIASNLNKSYLASHADALGGATVQITYEENTHIGQALQLAKQSHQLPDIHPTVGLGLPLSALIDSGWFQPLQLSGDAAARVKKMPLLQGVHIFDGKTYGFPLWDTRAYVTTNWFNKDLVSQAGLDPAKPPATYDEFRAAAKTVQSKNSGKVYGWIFNLKMTGRVGQQVEQLAQGAGFEGSHGAKYRTGEFAYDDETYVNAIEFLYSLKVDKLLVPGSSNFIDKDARARWATGIAAYFFDGPWVPGNVKIDYAQFKDKLAAGPMLVPEQGMEPVAYTAPPGGPYYVSASSKHPDLASVAIGLLSAKDYQTAYAGTMGWPPADPSAVADSDAYPVFKQVCGMYRKQVHLAPTAVAGNPDISKVSVAEKPVKPDLGTIVQGYFSGDVKDLHGALKKLSDASSQARQAAVAAAKKKGAQVSADDFAFPNWKPGKDYTQDMYT